jgi:hypothetical protein
MVATNNGKQPNKTASTIGAIIGLWVALYVIFTLALFAWNGADKTVTWILGG